MPSNLSRRVAKLESETGNTDRVIHYVDMSQVSPDYDEDRALRELDFERNEGDMVVIYANVTGDDPGGKPKYCGSQPFAR